MIGQSNSDHWHMTKKILIFSTAYDPFIAGAEIAVRELTARMQENHFDLITAKIQRDLKSVERIGNVTVYRVGLGWKLDKLLLPVLGFMKAKHLERSNSYDIVWSIMASHASIAAAFFKIRHVEKFLILTLQEGDEERHLARYVLGNKTLYRILIRPWHLLVFKKANAITAISNYLRDRAKKSGSKAPVYVIPNAVDVQHFALPQDEVTVQAIKNKFDKTERDVFLITTSRLVKKNAVDDVIRALKRLPENLKFLIVGTGPDEALLRQIAVDSNVEDRTLFVGHVPHEEIVHYLKASDIFIRPSLSEGMGNSFIEAMAAGLPVIATPVGGIVDFLFDPDKSKSDPTGYFCGVRNPQSIAYQVKRILENQKERDMIVANARKLVQEKYDWDLIARDMNERVFHSITS